jgi:RNA polymerase sigma factor (sigma-70 family)
MLGDELTRIKNGDAAYFRNFNSLYRACFIRWACNRFSCSVEDAEDVFQEAVLALIDQLRNKEFTELSCSIKTYFWSIGKNLLLNMVKKNAHFINIDFEKKNNEMGIDLNAAEVFFDQEHIKKEAYRYLSICSETEMGVMEDMFYEGLDAKTIAAKRGLPSEGAVWAIKCRCLKKFTKIMKDCSVVQRNQ